MLNIRFLLLLMLLAAGTARAVESHAVVFMYHRFGEERYPSTSIRLEQFEAQLEWLDDNGYRVWPLERVMGFLQTGKRLPDKTVVITIDDAYASVYEEAYPRLRARGWPFTVFVATDPVDQGVRDYMSWDQMREMAAFGVRFANHSATHDHLHRRLPGESERQWRDRVTEDVMKAQRRLQEELGEHVNADPRFFAYPYGEFDARLGELMQSMGFTAFGQQSGPVGPHSDGRALPRYPMAEAFAPLEQFAVKAASLPLPVTAAEPWNPVLSAEGNPPKLKLRIGDSQAALDRIACYTSDGKAIDVERGDEGRFTVSADRPFPSGRARYNCTAPHRTQDRYYWYSHLWIVPAAAD